MEETQAHSRETDHFLLVVLMQVRVPDLGVCYCTHRMFIYSQLTNLNPTDASAVLKTWDSVLSFVKDAEEVDSDVCFMVWGADAYFIFTSERFLRAENFFSCQWL